MFTGNEEFTLTCCRACRNGTKTTQKRASSNVADGNMQEGANICRIPQQHGLYMHFYMHEYANKYAFIIICTNIYLYASNMQTHTENCAK